MKIMYYVILVVGIVVSISGGEASLASAKTIEAGDSSSSWNGSGEVQDLVDGEQVINGIVKGVLIARHKGEGKLIVHSSKLVCPVRVTVNKKNDYKAIAGLCTIVAHEGKDVAYAQWKC
ncbi:MAG: hypothetical protein HY038_08350, partial [Nitrospirae bacterium]|nr:hypothetical protein [Nitrospirota bacterium]